MERGCDSFIYSLTKSKTRIRDREKGWEDAVRAGRRTTHILTTRAMEVRTVYCSKVSQAAPDRPYGKGKYDIFTEAIRE